MALTWKKLKYDEVSDTSKILGRKTSGAGAIEELTLSEVMDFIGSAASGDILYRGASAWARLPKGSDGQVLTLASGVPSWAAASGGSSIYVKPSDETVNNSTMLQDDDYFVDIPLAPSSTYIFQLVLIFDPANATPGVKGYFDFDNNATSGRTTSLAIDSGTTAFTANSQAATASFGAFGNAVFVATEGWIYSFGSFVTAANTTSCVLKWAQQTAHASNTILKAGSYLILTKV